MPLVTYQQRYKAMRIQGDMAARPLRGVVVAPGDKSISHRALVIATLARGTSTIAGVNRGRDVASTMSVLARLGGMMTLDRDKAVLKVEGLGFGGLEEPDAPLETGNSGTTMRLLTGVCAAAPLFTVITGDDSVRRRPMERPVTPLRAMGASIDGRADGALAPLAVRGGGLEGVDVRLPVASAQTKSALMLAGLGTTGITSVTEPGRSRDHTERMLRACGVDVAVRGLTASVERRCEVSSLDHRIPGDLSSAMFLVAAATLVKGSDLSIGGVGLNPTRAGPLEALIRMGAELEWDATEEWGQEPVGSLRARASELHGTVVEGSEIPGLIDELPVLAVLASQAQGTTLVRDAAELRVKESDRIQAVVEGLRALGGAAEALSDGMAITGPTPLHGGVVRSRGDHRIALAFAVAGLVASGEVEITGWPCIDTSFPEFLDLLNEARSRG
jgi:3-phosphoshikimate 1-carboxyvinyltransferase